MTDKKAEGVRINCIFFSLRKTVEFNRKRKIRRECYDSWKIQLCKDDFIKKNEIEVVN